MVRRREPPPVGVVVRWRGGGDRMTADPESVAEWSMRVAFDFGVTRLRTLAALTAAHDEGLTREAARRRAEQLLRDSVGRRD